MNVLITGASGFVGSVLCALLARAGHAVRGAIRRPLPTSCFAQLTIGEIDGKTDWEAALRGVNAVVHLAARVHVVRGAARDPLEQFRHVNVLGTQRLARAAREAGVKRFVFLSSVKVNGEVTRAGHPFTERDEPAPEDAYGWSKLEAERALHALGAGSGMECVILRPPLIYGPGVKGNFLSLLKAVRRRLPLPLGAIDNLRSLLFLGNLVSAIECCLDHPGAAGRTFLLSDGEDLSTRDLIRRIALSIGREPRLLLVPDWLLSTGATLSGQGPLAQRLIASLQVDGGEIRRQLDWKPPCSVDDGLRETATWFLAQSA